MGYSSTFPILRNEASNEAFGDLIDDSLLILLLLMMTVNPHIAFLSVKALKESFN